MSRGPAILCRLVAVLTALAGLIPAGVILYKQFHWLEQDKTEEFYFTTHLIEALIAAMAGFSVAYVLVRISRRKR